MSNYSYKLFVRAVVRDIRVMCNKASPQTEKWKILYGEDITEDLAFQEGLADECCVLAGF